MWRKVRIVALNLSMMGIVIGLVWLVCEIISIMMSF